MSYLIREILSNQTAEYKTFFTRGLAEDADSFRISPADELSAPFPTLDRPDSFTLGAFAGSQWLGVVSFEREGRTREKLRHKGLLFRMYVAPEARGQGAGRALIDAVIGRARGLPDLERINLTVLAHNVAARALYLRFGFQAFALERNALKWRGRYFDEEQMTLAL